MYLGQQCLTFFGEGPHLLLCSDSFTAMVKSTVSLIINLPDYFVISTIYVYNKVNQSHYRCPEGSRKLKFPDYVTMAQDGGKDVSLTHRPFYPQEVLLVLTSVIGWVDPRAIVRWEALCQ